MSPIVNYTSSTLRARASGSIRASLADSHLKATSLTEKGVHIWNRTPPNRGDTPIVRC
jgi:hypothetical protein